MIDLTCDGCGQRHANAAPVTLPDGQIVARHSETFRAYCEAITVIRWQSRDMRIDYLRAVSARRGQAAASALEADVRYWWKHRDTLRCAWGSAGGAQ